MGTSSLRPLAYLLSLLLWLTRRAEGNGNRLLTRLACLQFLTDVGGDYFLR